MKSAYTYIIIKNIKGPVNTDRWASSNRSPIRTVGCKKGTIHDKMSGHRVVPFRST